MSRLVPRVDASALRTWDATAGARPADVDRADGEHAGLARTEPGARARRARSGMRSRASGRRGRAGKDRGARRRSAAEAGRRHSPRAHGDAIHVRLVPRWPRGSLSPPAGGLLRADVDRAPYSSAMSPSSTTSCSSSTPNCSRARRRASAIRARQSAVVAPPAFSMKFACFGEIRAPPIRWPLRPHASSIAPAPSSPGGFLNTEPNVRFVVGCVALRRSTRSRTVARISLSSRGSSRYSTAATTWPWWMLECRYEKPSSAGVSQPVPSGGGDERSDHDRAPVASVGAGVHPHAPTGRARDRARELEATERRGACSVQADRVRRAAAGRERRSLRPRLDQLAGEMEDEHVDARRRRRAGSSRARPSRPEARAPAQPRGRPRAPAPTAARHTRARGRRCRSSSAARARRPPRRRERSLAAALSTIACAIFHGSPTPNVITRSPGRTHASASVAASSGAGAQPARTSGGSESTTSLPETPSRGASRAPMMSVTIATSASPSARPSSWWSRRVRSTTCGW